MKLDVKEFLLKVSENISPNIVSITDTASASVNPGYYIFYIPMTVPSGYKYLAIGGFNISYAECSPAQLEWDDANSRVIFRIRNNYATALNVTVGVTAIFYK